MYNHVSSEIAYVTLEIELGASCLLGKCSINRAASHPCNTLIYCHRKEIGLIKVKGKLYQNNVRKKSTVLLVDGAQGL